MDEHTIVYIEWSDSAMHSGWKEDGTEYDIAKCCTAGILVEKNEEAVIIAQSASLDGKSWPFAEVLAIPACNITNMVEISKDGNIMDKQ